MDDWAALGYLVAAVLFILGLKRLSRPRTAVRGNQYGAAGMLVAVLVTLTDNSIIGFEWIVGGLILGTVVGALLAVKVQMTAMPELVALFNGFGGGASVLVAAASYTQAVDLATDTSRLSSSAALASLIGAVTFTGSLVAFAKLREALHWSGFPGITILSGLGVVAAVVFAVLTVVDAENALWLWLLVAVGAVLGLLVVVPIGGADMPVVIALLNSLSGMAAVAAGFVLDNSLLIIAGSLVGASGLILTQIMCVAMNRTLLAVMFSPAPVGNGAEVDDIYAGKVRSTSPDDVAMLLESAERVAIVPGYGLAVAQAQHAVRDLTRRLQDRGVEVVFGIHPVAGRMPGHMNVLLAEAEVSYERLVEMDDINPTFEQTDVTIVIGANDVVNPVARTDPSSPIAGMPILDVDKSDVVVVIKRSLSPGFAGISNPLFAADNALMLFGDGRQAVVDITKSLQAF
ncbi:MAG: NAD(P)(+) transhydrogenase (Re/Si-specific) subunit beta [Acidimicrobiaceae bacterium]|nr:NAD(P)(+) transhydrogenase (Re/Si-specific) subunit beta [Acidimicrobiaceae bacterium]MXW62859.1 NAD(P)(+) transhydrogenase (Re/Si-specific) subunit beta [Acidimicrobiaceae bacterium]MXW76181.1 NAD(P)(+) transhydrogenase (Re/Si-specific) subunit beta [Acidimicrobiaceae bacterium]MYC41779.1 NAD(P)(+) transhydrogenase (Re/Si-specific) subunit beta [Acidimicrobiaceae bacterium]MYD07529.1 NAD(P)(+) transhydrogenase (Re/Si-specific) subunit beta [Acidimicrobiaceae bacterium]